MVLICISLNSPNSNQLLIRPNKTIFPISKADFMCIINLYDAESHHLICIQWKRPLICIGREWALIGRLLIIRSNKHRRRNRRFFSTLPIVRVESTWTTLKGHFRSTFRASCQSLRPWVSIRLWEECWVDKLISWQIDKLTNWPFDTTCGGATIKL